MFGFGLGFGEVLLILALALLLFGNRLPGIARRLGQSLAVFRQEIHGIEEGQSPSTW